MLAPMASRTVLIAGLGVGGPTLAYWLLKYGFEPTIVEVAAEPRRGGYMIDFWGVGYAVAERMDLIGALREAGYRIDEVRLVDARNRRVAGIDGDLFRSSLGDRRMDDAGHGRRRPRIAGLRLKRKEGSDPLG